MGRFVGEEGLVGQVGVGQGMEICDRAQAGGSDRNGVFLGGECCFGHGGRGGGEFVVGGAGKAVYPLLFEPRPDISGAAGGEEGWGAGRLFEGAAEVAGIVAADQVTADAGGVAAKDGEAAQGAVVGVAKPQGVEVAVYGAVGVGREEAAALAVGQAAVDAERRGAAREGDFALCCGAAGGNADMDQFLVQEAGIVGLDLAGHAPRREEGGTVGVGGGEHDLVWRQAGGLGDVHFGLGAVGRAVADVVGGEDEHFGVVALDGDGAGDESLVDARRFVMAVAIAGEPDGGFRGDVGASDADADHRLLPRQGVDSSLI